MSALGRMGTILLAGLVLATVAAHLERGEPIPHSVLEPSPPATRLVLFWVDSLAVVDVAGPHLPNLQKHLPDALQGAVRECTDAVTVPCLMATINGVDRFSLGTLWSNFGGASGLPPESVLGVLQDRGLRIGFAGDERVAPALRGVAWSWVDPEGESPDAAADDERTMQAAMTALAAERIDVLIVHLRQADRVSHREKPGSEAYAAALDRIDRMVEVARAQLRPTDHVSVLGDHGHTADGRHFAGLGVPTYAAYWGPRFERPMRRDMAITDHAAIWGHVFGVQFGQVPWVDAYFAGDEVPTTQSLPELEASATPMPLFAAALALAGALLLLVPWVGDKRRWRGVSPLAWIGGGALLLAATAALGHFFVDYRPLLYGRSYARTTLTEFAWGLPGLALVWAITRASPSPALRTAPAWLPWVAGALLLSIPTVYRFGGFVASTSVFLLVVVVTAIWHLARRRWQDAAHVLAFAAVFITLWTGYVVNFRLDMFIIFRRFIDPYQWIAASALIGGAWWLTRTAQRGAPGTPAAASRVHAIDAAFLCAVGLAALVPYTPPTLWIVPCVVVLPLALLALRAPRFAPFALAAAGPAFAFFFNASALRLVPVAAALLLWPLWARISRDAHAGVRSLGLVVMFWATYWAAFGCRVNGLDFSYFFQWLPPGEPVEQTWLENTVLTAALYMALPLVGLILFRLVAPVRDGEAGPFGLLLKQTSLWARAKLAAVLAFALGFAVRGATIGTAVTADIVLECAFWMFVLLTLAIVPRTFSARALASAWTADSEPLGDPSSGHQP